jgi:4-hydroxy-tetrahydrodipicolinate synthase
MEDINRLPLNGIQAIMHACPYYNKPSQEGLFHHFRSVAYASPAPVLLYNVPGRTGINLQVDTCLRIAREVSNVIGIKEAGGDLIAQSRLLRDRPADFMVLSGDDHLALAQLALGMDGLISVAGNAYPAAISQLTWSMLDGQMDSARMIHLELLEAFDLLMAENNPAGIKCLLHAQWKIVEELRLPLTSVTAPLRERIVAFDRQFQLRHAAQLADR